MLKQMITYTDPFTEETIEEEFYFHLSKADIIHMELGKAGGGLKAHIERIVAAENAPEVMKVFKDIIGAAYGKRIDGRFVKNQQFTDEFLASEAYGELLMMLMSTEGFAAEFINAIAPKAEQVAAAAAKPAPAPAAAAAAIETVESLEDTNERAREIAHATKENPVVLSGPEIGNMDGEVLKAGIADGRYKLS